MVDEGSSRRETFGYLSKGPFNGRVQVGEIPYEHSPFVGPFAPISYAQMSKGPFNGRVQVGQTYDAYFAPPVVDHPLLKPYLGAPHILLLISIPSTLNLTHHPSLYVTTLNVKRLYPRYPQCPHRITSVSIPNAVTSNTKEVRPCYPPCPIICPPRGAPGSACIHADVVITCAVLSLRPAKRTKNKL